MSKVLPCFLAVATSFCETAASAQLKVLSNAEPISVFSGDAKRIQVVLHNDGTQAFDGNLRAIVYQTTSATAAPFLEMSRKRIRMLPEQTVIETVRIDIPAVRNPTGFLIEWLDERNRVAGNTRVLVYPTNLLSDLVSLSETGAIGVSDREHVVKPVLATNGIGFVDLDQVANEMTEISVALVLDLAHRFVQKDDAHVLVEHLAKRGVATVWIRSQHEKRDKLWPSFYTVTDHRGAVVVAQPEVIENLAENPRAQLNLIHLARMALNPEPLTLRGSPLAGDR